MPYKPSIEAHIADLSREISTLPMIMTQRNLNAIKNKIMNIGRHVGAIEQDIDWMYKEGRLSIAEKTRFENIARGLLGQADAIMMPYILQMQQALLVGGMQPSLTR